jgi:hypothetical protein
MAVSTTADWLDAMPAIRPLKRGVPVTPAAHHPDLPRGPVTVLDTSEGVQVFIHCSQRIDVWDLDDCRVDLDVAAGFGFALRWCVMQHTGPAKDAEQVWKRLSIWDSFSRHVCGKTTDADKLALAHACAALVEGGL